MAVEKGVIIYESKDGEALIEVNLKDETVWLSQKQMSVLFGRDVRTINEHLSSVYKEGELDKSSTIRKFRIVRNEGNRSVSRNIDHYNLDVIISVGYRVKSRQGTQFRIWATNVLKQHLIDGYSVNEKRLQELQQTIKLLRSIVDAKNVSKDEAKGLLRVISDYSYALDTLDKFDHSALEIEQTSEREIFRLDYFSAVEAISELRNNLGGSELFGNQKDDSFKSSISAIYQSFDGRDLYPSVEEKAAHLLYFVIKNHSFSDGNKRIAAFIFVWFLERNHILYRSDGSKRIADNALVALTLMIAESKPREKNMMVKVVVSLINKNN